MSFLFGNKIKQKLQRIDINHTSAKDTKQIKQLLLSDSISQAFFMGAWGVSKYRPIWPSTINRMFDPQINF